MHRLNQSGPMVLLQRSLILARIKFVTRDLLTTASSEALTKVIEMLFTSRQL